jgi:hypothetical protein
MRVIVVVTMRVIVVVTMRVIVVVTMRVVVTTAGSVRVLRCFVDGDTALLAHTENRARRLTSR